MSNARVASRAVLRAVGLVLAVVVTGSAQTPPAQPPMERVTFSQAVERALQNNLTIAQVATGVLRAEGLLQQARAATLPNVNANLNTAILNSERGFEGVVTQPRTQTSISAAIGMPVLALSRWAAVTQSRDQVEIANLSIADVRRDIAVSAAQAYIAILAAKRQVEVSVQARDAALAHLDYAQRRLASGAGTRLNELRAAQEVSVDESRIEVLQFAARQAQEALGVLLNAPGPVDTIDEPVLDVPAVIDDASWMTNRADIRLSEATQRAAERVWRDSNKDYFPLGTISFEPALVTPASVFTSGGSWRFVVNFSQPVFDAGLRSGIKRVRESASESSRLQLTSLQTQARSEVRIAQEQVRSRDRVLVSLRRAAQQAEEVVSITNTAFEAGATTNLEVIDAQRTARDAESAAAIAEDAVRRARLELLAAIGRFPQ
jgi:outer membrane protein TolC